MATITLKHPITVNDEQVTELHIPDRIKLKHLKSMDNAAGEIGKLAALIGALAKLPMSAVDDIDADDLDALSEVFGSFLDKLPATGAK